MDKKLEELAAAVGRHPELAERLDRIMTCPNDRAYLVCTLQECKYQVKGECTVYTVLDPPPSSGTRPCVGYEQVT